MHIVHGVRIHSHAGHKITRVNNSKIYPQPGDLGFQHVSGIKTLKTCVFLLCSFSSTTRRRPGPPSFAAVLNTRYWAMNV